MTHHYTGDERRDEHGGGHWNGEDRRTGEPCAIHTFVMENCNTGRKETAEKLKDLSKEKMDWKVFALIAILGAGIIGSGFGYFGSQLAGIDKKYTERDEKIASTMMQVSNIQAGLVVEISYLKQYDVQDRLEKNNRKGGP